MDERTRHTSETFIRSGQDLGIGDVLSGQKRQRLLNRNGTFNVMRNRKRLRDDLTYATLLRVPWGHFLAAVILLFVCANLAFAGGYVLCGHDSLALNGPDPRVSHYWRAFFFSVHTFATIGYGNVVPVGLLANLLVVVESFIGLFGFSLVTGLLFARFAKPIARIRFSERAVMRSNREPALLVRMTNASRSELIELNATALASFFDPDNPKIRRYLALALERDHISFLPLAWTLLHKIEEGSPLHGMSHDEFRRNAGEILIQVKGIDQSTSQTVYTRISYTADDIDWHARYADMYVHEKRTGLLGIDMDRFDTTFPLEP